MKLIERNGTIRKKRYGFEFYLLTISYGAALRRIYTPARGLTRVFLCPDMVEQAERVRFGGRQELLPRGKEQKQIRLHRHYVDCYGFDSRTGQIARALLSVLV